MFRGLVWINIGHVVNMAIVRVITVRMKMPRDITMIVHGTIHRDGWLNHDTSRRRRLCDTSRRTVMRECERSQHHESGGEPTEPAISAQTHHRDCSRRCWRRRQGA